MSEVLPSMEELLDRAYQRGRADIIEEYRTFMKSNFKKCSTDKCDGVCIDCFVEQLNKHE